MSGERIDMTGHVREVAQRTLEAVRESSTGKGLASRTVHPRAVSELRERQQRRSFTIPCALLEEMIRFANSPEGNPSRPRLPSIPSDARLVGGSYLSEVDSFSLVFESDLFEDLPEAEPEDGGTDEL